MNEMKERLENLGCQILSMSRNELYLSMRFLDMALGAFVYEMDLSTKTLGTDGDTIRFNPKYLTYLYECDRVLINRAYLHMILHGIFGHSHSRQKRIKRFWHLACDISTESVIDQMTSQAVHLVVSDRRNEMYDRLHQELKVLTAQGVYKELIKMQMSPVEFDKMAREFEVDDHGFWEQSHDDQGKNDQQNQQQQKKQQKKWQEISQKMQTNLSTISKDAGEDAGDLKERLDIVHHERYDYRSFLRKFSVLKEEIALDMDSYDYIYYMYGLDHYGNMPLIEPLEYKETKKIEEFAIVIDTSESCSKTLVQTFLNETYSLLMDSESFFKKVNIHIIQCDTVIQKDTVIHCVDELRSYMETFDVCGSGGTDFSPAFDYVAGLIEKNVFHYLKGLIYFTDGYGTFPKKRPQYDTAFVFVAEDYTDVSVPPWAIKLILEPDDILREEAAGEKSLPDEIDEY